jgi:hypothetical protein
MCLAFIYKVESFDKKAKKVIVSHKIITKEVINPYQIEIKKGDMVRFRWV